MLRLARLILACGALASAQKVADVRRGYENPPADTRIMMRWWWFGPAVTKPELEREMRLMKEGGIGGFEVQPVYPLALDGSKPGFRNLPYLSDEFIDALRFTSEKAHELGLRMDLTLASGWPYGGPHTPITEAAGRLLTVTANVPAGESSLRIRKLAEGEKFIAAFAGMERLPDPKDGVIAVKGPQKVQYFIAGRTKMMVKRAAAGAEGYVLDHYDRGAIDHHLKVVGDRLMQAFGPYPPYAVFSDSLEVFASDWTGDLLDEFRKRRGYDLTPYLPALVSDTDKSGAVRCDWGKTLTELVEERYLKPVEAWARAHHTRFRSQTYGTPPVALSSNALVDLPEGEHPNWRQFSQTRWAASASHLYGKPVTSSETWTWLHSPVFRATPLDMKAEADLHFLQGINQLIGHGWPYSPPDVAGYPGWRFYAAAVFDNGNPWWVVMPEITKYLQRTSYLLRQGKPANDVALYLPTSDARAHFTGGRGVSVDRSMDGLLGDTLIPQILDAGYNFDYIDDAAIEKMGVPYPILILPGVERIPLAAYKKIEEYAKKGGIVVATRRLPSAAPGLLEGERDTAAVRALSDSLFRERAHLVKDEKTLGTQLHSWLQPDFMTDPPAPAIGFVHRKLDDGDIYFLANTSNQPVHTRVAFRGKGAGGELDLAPYESRYLIFSARSPQEEPKHDKLSESVLSNWKETRQGTAQPFFSGTITYEQSVNLPKAARQAWLDFGEGTPVPEARTHNGMRAWLESPVREAAVVYVNGQRAGAVWAPPYRLEITKFLRPGENQLRIVVGNLALNALAGQKLPDYKELIAKYGDRFQPQDLEDLKPLPAGLTGQVKLETR
jgi:alpha-L-rhamnosidase